MRLELQTSLSMLQSTAAKIESVSLAELACFLCCYSPIEITKAIHFTAINP